MQDYSPGTRIGQYEITSQPMKGAMGMVYFCIDHGNAGRPVALKTFLPKFLPDRKARDLFLREGTAWVEMGYYPHIVRCYDVKYIDPTAFLILELINNGKANKVEDSKDASLQAWIGQPMPVTQAVVFALQIARGMQHATKKVQGFVHRDLKPANVLVGADKLSGTKFNRLRVTDFGLIKIVSESNVNLPVENADVSKLTQIQFTHDVGTPLYMAREQWLGEPVGVFTDVYALGCILYEMLTGECAADGFDQSELKDLHCNGKLRPIPVDLPKPVRAFLESSLAVSVAKRYQTWEEVTAVLESLSDKLGLGFIPPENDKTGESTAERQSTASSYNAMGIAYAHMGKSQVALGYFEKALGIFQEIHDQYGEGSTLNNQGNAYKDLGDARRALNYYEQDLAIARKLGDRHWEGWTLSNIGEVYRNLGEAHRAVNSYEQSLKIMHEIGDRHGEGNALCGLGLLFAASGEVHRAIAFFEQYLAIERSLGNRRGEGIALGNLGNMYKDLGDLQRAVEFYQQYLEIARGMGDRVGEGNALGNMGSIYLQLGNSSDALCHLKKSRFIMREVGDQRGKIFVLNNLGTAFAALGKPDKAFRYYQLSFQIAREIGDPDGLCMAMFNVGQLYMQDGQSQNALRAWANLYLFAKNKNLTRVLQRLDGLAPKVGISDGLKGWERLSQALKKQGF